MGSGGQARSTHWLDWTLNDLLEQLGGVPAERVRMVPMPGTATEEDLLAVESRTGRVLELIDGVLVEKVVGWYEMAVAVELAWLLKRYVQDRGWGVVLRTEGPLRIFPGQVRSPAVAYVSFQRLGRIREPVRPVLPVAPDLAVEVLSETNTPGEMERKLRDYFAAGVESVWYIDPKARTARTYSSLEECETISDEGFLRGGRVLPGLVVSLREIFQKAHQPRPDEPTCPSN
ncbi:MAG: Uma2 family endonuclease [Thermoguttaceae bacterium]|nr:Uma2 family endonuclease [Thermoguttaceae bacterium]MDW8039030.1 Uma2 family endonuclease [Thermoguttaceae bacterium]